MRERETWKTVLSSCILSSRFGILTESIDEVRGGFMWHFNDRGEKIFIGGKDAWDLAALAPASVLSLPPMLRMNRWLMSRGPVTTAATGGGRRTALSAGKYNPVEETGVRGCNGEKKRKSVIFLLNSVF